MSLVCEPFGVSLSSRNMHFAVWLVDFDFVRNRTLHQFDGRRFAMLFRKTPCGR